MDVILQHVTGLSGSRICLRKLFPKTVIWLLTQAEGKSPKRSLQAGVSTALL